MAVTDHNRLFAMSDSTDRIERARLLNETLKARSFDRKRLVALRTKLEASQDEMSALFGLGEKVWHLWESGKKTPSVSMQRYIALVARCPHEFLQLLQP